MRLLQRHVLQDVLIVTLLALIALTLLLMSAGVIAEARKAGLGPQQILLITPFLIPGTLPYPIPLSILFGVTTVYGRMSGWGEITAIKASGISITAILWPVLLLGAALSVATLFLSDPFVPWARAGIRSTVLNTLEDVIYDILRNKQVLYDDQTHVRIIVKDVIGKQLIAPTFMYRTQQGSDVVARADEASLHIDHEAGLIHIRMDNANLATSNGSTLTIKHFDEPIALPGWNRAVRKKPQDFTIEQMRREIHHLGSKESLLKAQASIGSVFSVMSGDPQRLLDNPLHKKLSKKLWRIQRDIRKFRTEMHSRRAMSFSCFFFVMLGAPIAIWGQRADFMGNFFLCVVTILFAYYPLSLLGMNLCKEGLVEPSWMMWTGNAFLGMSGTTVLRKVLRH